MSRAGSGSVVSHFTALTNKSLDDNDSETTNSLLQTCVYLKDHLGLEGRAEAVGGDDEVKSFYHVKISSKTLKKTYALPYGTNDIDDVFVKLAALVKQAKDKNVKPPKSDFTCSSALEYNKLFLDLDCVMCKRGEDAGVNRHFKSTKLFNTILSTVARTFNETLAEGVYLTNGRATCGYHVFFNTIAIHYENVVSVKQMLFAELEYALKLANLNHLVTIDRACTQMPLPTARHSNSTHYTTPYRMKMVCENRWDRQPMRWLEMDAELLKCFSSISFSRHHNWIVVPKQQIPTVNNLSTSSLTMELTGGDTTRCDDTSNIAVSPNAAKKRKAGTDVNGSAVEGTTVEPVKKRHISECNYSVLTADTSKEGGSFVVPGTKCSETDNDSVSTVTNVTSAAESFIMSIAGDTAPTATKTVTAVIAATVEDKLLERVVTDPTDCDRDGEMLSLLTEVDSFGAAASFAVPPELSRPTFTVPPTPLASKKRRYENPVRKGDRKTSHYMTTTTVCDRFADKEYRNSLLRIEEADAASSSVILLGKSDESRVYELPGTSWEKTRKYKLLVQLQNVNRAVYADDKFRRREWTDIKVSYYDQHLNNPVILKMFDFIFRDKCAKDLFQDFDLDKILQSITYLMTPFEVKECNNGILNPDDLSAARAEKEARPHKSRLVGALTRVCTEVFVMITAIVADFRKIQLVKKYKNQKLLNCTIMYAAGDRSANRINEINNDEGDDNNNDDDDDDNDDNEDDEDGPNCSASVIGRDDRTERFTSTTGANRPSDKKETIYALLASLIVYEEHNLSDDALHSILYYYHYFPTNAMTKIMNEVQHEGLMVTAMIRFFLAHGHQRKSLTLLEIFDGFNDVSISLWGAEKYIMVKRKNKRINAVKSNNNGVGSGSGGSGGGTSHSNKKRNSSRNTNAPRPRNSVGDDNSSDSIPDFDSTNIVAGCNADNVEPAAQSGAAVVTQDEINKLLSGCQRRRKMLSQRTKMPGNGEYLQYEWKEKHMWQAIVNYYLRPVVMHDDRLVFVNNGYDTIEEDAIESCVAHVVMKEKITKADVATAFKDARTMWRMPHGSQFIYESDLVAQNVGCCFHINVALKIYEMFCGGCLTRMKRVHNNYLIDSTRFNMSVYDVVAECKAAAVSLTSAVDRSYMNLLLRQPVVPAVFEDIDTRQLFMSDAELNNGSFCCLTTMDYIRALNLFERANCQSKYELETCDLVEKFLDDVYVGELAADVPPNASADLKTRLLYTFYSLFIYEVLFNMRHAYSTRENCFVSIERLCKELDVRELLVLFFGESSMRLVEGLPDEMKSRIRDTADDLSAKKLSSMPDVTAAASCTYYDYGENGRFDVRPVIAADIPDKVSRMKALFGQFGFNVMQHARETTEGGTNSFAATADIDCDMNIAAAVFEDDRDRGVETTTTTTTEPPDVFWTDDSKFEELFYTDNEWLENTCRRVSNKAMNGKNSRNVPILSAGKKMGKRVSDYGGGGSGSSTEPLFIDETVRTVMQLQLKRHIDHDRLGRLYKAFTVGDTALEKTLAVMKLLPMRLKLLAFILTVHTSKLKTKKLAAGFVDNTYCGPDGLFVDDCCAYKGEVNQHRPCGDADIGNVREAKVSPAKLWFTRTETMLNDRHSLLLHARWMAEKRFSENFFVGLNPVQVYNVLYDFMSRNQDEYPAFKQYNEESKTRTTVQHLCTAMMFLLVMSAYDEEELELYLKMFLAVEWPGQWAKTIFVWKSNSNAGKSYLFDGIIKRACATSTCINDPKGGKENAPEKAEYVRNFVLFANEFSQANSNELKKIVSESTFKFRMNYGNMMNEVYATGKIMVNCNTLPPTSDEAAINRLTLFSMPFWFSKRQSISDALFNWTRGHNVADRDHYEMAYRYELPSLFTDNEREFFKSHENTKNEADLFDGYAALRPNMFSGHMDFSKATASLFLVQNKISRLYVSSAPPTEQIVHGLVNITRHFSWLRFFNQLDAPVDFTTLPATSEAVRSEWLRLTLPYQEWKHATGARHDATCRTTVGSINKSLQAFASKKNVNYFGIRQFFETDFASSREAIENVYYVKFDNKAFLE